MKSIEPMPLLGRATRGKLSEHPRRAHVRHITSLSLRSTDWLGYRLGQIGTE